MRFAPWSGSMSHNLGISCSIWSGGGAALEADHRPLHSKGTKILDTLTGQERGRCSLSPPSLRLTSDQSRNMAPLRAQALGSDAGRGCGGSSFPPPHFGQNQGFSSLALPGTPVPLSPQTFQVEPQHCASRGLRRDSRSPFLQRCPPSSASQVD